MFVALVAPDAETPIAAKVNAVAGVNVSTSAVAVALVAAVTFPCEVVAVAGVAREV
jgi:hypothetical protein